MNRSVRIFLSSTFRDYGEERDLLVRKVFPNLRAKLKDRFVELVDVDLRWGITVQQAERGEVLPICLAEIDRARPYFVGMLGDRYGWIPPKDAYAPDLVERQPWLNDHRGGKSVTELEMLHGVLNNPKMAGRALFYFRSSSYAKLKGGDYLPESPADHARQQKLKERISQHRFPVVRYRDPEAFAKRLEKDLWKLLDNEFPATSVPDAYAREGLKHEAYAAPRRRLYLGGEKYLVALSAAIAKKQTKILIEGASGGGKSALLANWLQSYRTKYPKHLLFEYYLGASTDSADPVILVRRLIETIKRVTGSSEEIADDPQKLYDSIPTWLATASSYAGKRKTQLIIAIDSLNSLTDLRDLRWLPEFLPPNIYLIISSLPGEVKEALLTKVSNVPNSSKNEQWHTLLVKPLTSTERKKLLITYLANYNKTLAPDLIKQALAHSLSNNPLFLRTLAEELRLFGVHEELQKRLKHYLTSKTIDDLFERVLKRVEGDNGKEKVQLAMQAIWASRAGLTEKEILAIVNLKPATWAPIRNALDECLLESNGKIAFAHDYMRIAVKDRYLKTKLLEKQAHIDLAEYFQKQVVDARRSEEEPYQWLKADDRKQLKILLLNKEIFLSFFNYRNKYELLSYWQIILQRSKNNIDKEYETSWTNWTRSITKQDELNLSIMLAKFLHFSGFLGNFPEFLYLNAINILKKDKINKKKFLMMECFLEMSNLLISRNLSNDFARAKFLLTAASKKIRKNIISNSYTRCWNLLAMSAIYEGNNALAERIYKKILVHDEKNYGSEDPYITASTLNNLGDLYCSIKDYPRALIYLEKCLQIRQLKLPKDDLLLAVTRDNLGKVYAFLGRFNEANFLHLKALEVRTNILGKAHPERNNSVINFATNLYRQGDFFQALPLYLEATYWDSKKFGEFSDYVLYDLMGSLRCVVKIFERDGNDISQKSESLILQGVKLVKTIFSKVLTGEIHDENLLYSLLTPTIEFLDLFTVKKEVIRDNKIFENISDLISSDFVPKSIKNDLNLIIQNK
jgi:nephrocystin-3